MDFCPFVRYKEIFGTPNKGVHRYKFLKTSVIDYALTLVVSALTTYFTKIPFVLTTIIWFIMGIVFHILFGVQTEATKFLGMGCR